jgi:hypothetical protein
MYWNEVTAGAGEWKKVWRKDTEREAQRETAETKVTQPPVCNDVRFFSAGFLLHFEWKRSARESRHGEHESNGA